MTRPDNDVLIAFLEDTLAKAEREQVLKELASDPALEAELREAAAGLEALRSMAESAPPTGSDSPGSKVPRGKSVSLWWVAAAASLATLAIAVPVTMNLTAGSRSGAITSQENGAEALQTQFVLVLRGRWSDAGGLGPDQFRDRMDEYWAWTSQLADDGVLVATSDLALDQGLSGPPSSSGAPESERIQLPDYVVGIFTLRMDSYQEALAIARSCPHLRFGGSVTVQRVSGGFVTVSGMRDWTS